MLKRIIVVFLIVIIIIAGWFLNLLWTAGQFKTIKPHFAGTCKPVTGISGAEDITIHPKTGIAYISAYDRRAVGKGKEGNGGIFVYSLSAANPALIKLTSGTSKDFRPHGISLYTGKNGDDVLFVINHSGGRHSIEKYALSGDQLIHRKTIADPALVSPNDIVAVGPDSFYITNDHGSVAGLMRFFEDYMRLKRSNVVFYNGTGFSEAAADIGYANGINVSADGKTLFLSAVTEQSLIIFDRDSTSAQLSLRQKIDLGTGVDNIEVDPQGDLWVGAHPQLLKFVSHAKDPAVFSPSQIIHLSLKKSGDYQIDEIYLNDGSEISGSSVAAVYQKRMLIGSVFEPKFLDCRIK